METFTQYADRTIVKLRSFLSTDATHRKLDELLARVDRGEVITTEDARIVVRTLVELDNLHKRCRSRVEQIEREIAERPANVQAAYRQEMERGRR